MGDSASDDDELAGLGGGLRFDHIAEMQAGQRLTEISASLSALIETLVAHGVVPLDELEQRRGGCLTREADRARSPGLVTLHDDVDKYALGDLPEIDCAALVPLCRARCCTFAFPLSGQDLDEGALRWDLGRPYQIRHRTDGYCVHNDGATRSCGVHAQRPARCRTFDCRNDERIWLDFERRLPAP